MSDMAVADGATQLTLQAADQIRDLIVRRVLLPGEKIRQVELADRIGVSRSPLREALRTLESEGVVAYEVNRGYVVAKLDDDDLAQIFRMRALLEDELLRTVKHADAAVLGDLKDLNEKMMVAIDERNVTDVLRYNREFHFTIFDLSPLNQFRREVRRLWQMSEGYSAAWCRQYSLGVPADSHEGGREGSRAACPVRWQSRTSVSRSVRFGTSGSPRMLVLSDRTVQDHAQNTRKLHLHNRVELVRYAIE